MGLLGVSILERREEAMIRPPLYPIAAMETDSSKWAVNFPREYDAYLRMKDTTTKTKYGGADPRDLLAETPENVILFSGYGFAKEYRQARDTCMRSKTSRGRSVSARRRRRPAGRAKAPTWCG